ncbi:MAG TPA: hypothetical protein VF602_03005 [Pedobacter sp.]|jgi:hypothetical protein
MPAIKYKTPHSVAVIPGYKDSVNHRVDLLLKHGGFQSVHWISFIPLPLFTCLDETHRFGKMSAISVTRDVGFPASDWRILKPDEFVLSWIVPYNVHEISVHTIVDISGMPIVMSPRMPGVSLSST